MGAFWAPKAVPKNVSKNVSKKCQKKGLKNHGGNPSSTGANPEGHVQGGGAPPNFVSKRRRSEVAEAKGEGTRI